MTGRETARGRTSKAGGGGAGAAEPGLAGGNASGHATDGGSGNGVPGDRAGANDAARNGGNGGLEAPHRRRGEGPRIHEKAVVLAYRGLSRLLAHVPARLAWWVGGWFALAAYVLWPAKRRWSQQNFGHVLRTTSSDPRARRLARDAYRHYARYSVELMRLPWATPAEKARLLDVEDEERVERVWKSSNGLIIVAGHLGNNEAAAAGFASRGMPISVVADDSSYGELFDLLKRQRAEWGVDLIPWRNLRAVYGVLRRREILALLVDWGYRADGIPVKFFGSWTALPAGPAVLAARNRSTIVPVVVRRRADGRFSAAMGEPIHVPSSAPADIQRATQAVADALEQGIAESPAQWYNFKPIWPPTPEEEVALANRAAAMLRNEPTADQELAASDGPATSAPRFAGGTAEQPSS